MFTQRPPRLFDHVTAIDLALLYSFMQMTQYLHHLSVSKPASVFDCSSRAICFLCVEIRPCHLWYF